jgi:biopolymer transport protein ExbB/TolQ
MFEIMKEFIATGGLTGMSIILILGIIILLITILVTVRRIMHQEYSLLDEKLMLSIKSLGGIAGLTGLFFQTFGLYLAFQAIQAAADISAIVVMKGVFVSFYSTFFGLGVFLVSMIIWYILKITDGDKAKYTPA